MRRDIVVTLLRAAHNPKLQAAQAMIYSSRAIQADLLKSHLYRTRAVGRNSSDSRKLFVENDLQKMVGRG